MIHGLDLLFAQASSSQEAMRLAWGILPAVLLFGIPIVAVGGGVTLSIVKVVTDNARRKQQAEMEATLKMEMIQRGMTAEDICQVLDARMASAAAPRWEACEK